MNFLGCPIPKCRVKTFGILAEFDVSRHVFPAMSPGKRGLRTPVVTSWIEPERHNTVAWLLPPLLTNR